MRNSWFHEWLIPKWVLIFEYFLKLFQMARIKKCINLAKMFAVSNVKISKIYLFSSVSIRIEDNKKIFSEYVGLNLIRSQKQVYTEVILELIVCTRFGWKAHRQTKIFSCYVFKWGSFFNIVLLLTYIFHRYFSTLKTK